MPEPGIPRPGSAGREAPVLVVDHGAGNLASMVRALRRGGRAELTSDPEQIAAAARLVLPGNGHFGEAMRGLRERRLERPLLDAVAGGAHLLGICVGLQMLFPESEESPGVPGLGLVPGVVRRFGSGVRAPHIGWNGLEEVRPAPLLAGVPEGGYAYFLHAYYADPAEPGARAAATDYGGRFASVVAAGRVTGIQFHPEKSGRLGARVLANFLGPG